MYELYSKNDKVINKINLWENAMRYISLGLIFTFFNFNFSILSYIMMYLGAMFLCLGLYKLKEENINFKIACNIAFVKIFLVTFNLLYYASRYNFNDKKVIIIHEGSKLTVQAQNALLKTIEEPPQGVYIILLAESLETLLDTIKSRCQVYKLTPLNNKQMEMYINTLGRYSEEEIRASLAYGEGIPGKAERLLNDSNLSELREVIMNLLKDINYAKEDLVLIYENKLENYKTEKDEILNLMASFIRDIIVAKELEDKNKIINIDKYNDIVEVANSLSYKKLNSMLEYIKEGRVNLMNNGNYSLVISVILMGFLEV